MSRLFILSLALSFLSACAYQPPATLAASSIPPIEASFTPLPPVTQTLVVSTNTPIPSATVAPTQTPVASFDPLHIQTSTPAPPALCPSITLEPEATPWFVDHSVRDEPDVLDQEVLDYLNTYGPQPIRLAHEQSGKPSYWFAYQDFTNDGISELAFVADLFHIYGCRHGYYQIVFKQTYLDGLISPFAIVSIQDGNQNGIPEIMFFAGQETQGGHSYRLYEWDGSQFQNLLVSRYPDDPDGGEIFVDAVEGNVEFRDLDHDGVQELVSTDGIPIWTTYMDGLPWRIERHFYKWDGNHYVDYHQEFDPPEYRFQAVQDGDRLSLSGDYDRALDLYQQAILNNNLKGWSPELREYLQEAYFATPEKPTPMSDENEADNLAAYARYRIMLLQLVRGQLPAARIVYNTLQAQFGKEKVGHLYAEMAAAFWADYLVSQNIEQACRQAIEYATLHKIEILHYLGNIKNTGDLSLAAGNLSLAFDHGYQSLAYSAADVCPFK